jgi:hypothetical protein
MDKFPQVPGSVIVQNFPNDWYYSDFLPVDRNINPIANQGGVAIAGGSAAPYGRILPVQLTSAVQPPDEPMSITMASLSQSKYQPIHPPGLQDEASLLSQLSAVGTTGTTTILNYLKKTGLGQKSCIFKNQVIHCNLTTI